MNKKLLGFLKKGPRSQNKRCLFISKVNRSSCFSRFHLLNTSTSKRQFNELNGNARIIAVDSNEAVVKMMQKEARKYLGYTVSVYKLFDTHALAIPVTSERANKPAKKSKKK